MQNYVIGVFGEGFRALIERAAESEGETKKTDVEERFGENADESTGSRRSSTRADSGTSLSRR